MTECRNLMRSKIREHARGRRDDELGWLWPGSTDALMKRVEGHTEPFWEYVVESHVIDISQFGFPTKKVKFTFVDPVFVWVQQANALANAGYDLHWRPRTLEQDGTNERLYGAGIQYGQLMEAACNSIPIGCRVGLFNLSWDGGETTMSSFSATPICVQVMNCNSACNLAVGLVGYVPVIDGVSDARKSTKEYREACRHVLQESVGLLVARIEATSLGGIRCNIGPDQNVIVFPRLGAMTLDTPERVRYFGLPTHKYEHSSALRASPFCLTRDYHRDYAAVLTSIRDLKRMTRNLQNGLDITSHLADIDDADILPVLRELKLLLDRLFANINTA